MAEGCEFGCTYELSKQVIPSCADRVLASRIGVEALIYFKSNCKKGVINVSVVRTESSKAWNNKVQSLKDEVRLTQILSI